MRTLCNNVLQHSTSENVSKGMFSSITSWSGEDNNPNKASLEDEEEK
jgi:hypothetical protein